MSRYLPDFAGLFCLAIFLISVTSISGEILRDGDPFWHIKAGTVMLEQRGLIDHDVFSHTAQGVPWTAHEWLSEIIMASVYKFSGLEGVVCFFLTIASISFWLLYKLTEKNANQWVTLGCVAVAIIFSPSHMAARPHLFTWLFMMITLLILEHGGKRLFWLPIIIIPWANLHGGFIICLVLQSIYIAGNFLEEFFGPNVSFRRLLKKQRTPLIVLIFSLLCSGLNPFGYELLVFPFQVSKGIFSQFIGEWKAPNFQDLWYFRYYVVALFLLVSLSKSAITWRERLLLIFFLNAALTHIRHISLMLMAITPFVAKVINVYTDEWFRQKNLQRKTDQIKLSPVTGPILTVIIAISLLIAGSTNYQLLRFMTPDKLIDANAEQLNQLTDFLAGDLPDGKMFNEYALGGYLLYALNPTPKVFIDGRADMYGQQILSDYNTIKESSAHRGEILEKYGIDWVVFEKNSELIQDLKKSPQWKIVFMNDHYAVLTHINSHKPSQFNPE